MLWGVVIIPCHSDLTMRKWFPLIMWRVIHFFSALIFSFSRRVQMHSFNGERLWWCALVMVKETFFVMYVVSLEVTIDIG